MTWRVRVQHRTGYTYSAEVASSFNEARMTPTTDATQTTLESRLEIKPAASTYRYRDYWGTEVASFDIHQPHSELVVTATSVVETNLRPPAPGGLGWDDLAHPEVKDRFTEWLSQTTRTAPTDGLAELAEQVAEGKSPTEAIVACIDAVHESMDYVLGATEVHTNGSDAWLARKGVCQDFAHISLAMMRSLAIPARYVSGYLHPRPTADINEVVLGETHAWIEAWDGEWVGYDPTNGRPVGDQHVGVARGRDYDDVTPLKGIYSGSTSSKLGVVVEVTRLA